MTPRSSLRDLDIFQSKVSSAVAKEKLIKEWDLYISSAFEPKSTTYKVVSISLFIFPGRVLNSNVENYRNNITEYIQGITGSLQYVHDCRPGWNVRVHVDYSIPLSTRLKGPKHTAVRAIANDLLDTLESLQYKYGETLQLVGVRRKFSKGKVRFTMFPAMYRFLPLFDHHVEIAMSSEADNPYNSLYHYFAQAEWLGTKKKYMFIIPDSYDIEHCLVYVSTHEDVKLRQFCPCMIWGGKRTQGDSNNSPIENPSKFTEMLAVQTDEDIRFLYSNIKAIRQLSKPVSEELSRGETLASIQRARDFQTVYELLLINTKTALSKLKTHSQVLRLDLTTQKIVDICCSSSDLVVMVVYILFSTILSRYVPAAKWIAHFNFLDKVVPAVIDEAYGVDEWLVRVLFDNAVRQDDAVIVNTSSLQHGIRFQDKRALQNDDPGNTLRLLNDLQGGNWPPYGEAIARCVIFLRILWPLTASKQIDSLYRITKSGYYKRLYLLGDSMLSTANIDYNVFHKLLDHLFYNNGFFMQASRHVMQVVESKLYSDFLRANRISFDSGQRRFKFEDVGGYQKFKAVLLRGCLLDMKMLHMFKIGTNHLAQNVPW